MGFAALIGAGGALLGSSMQADAAESAAQTQSDSTKYAIDRQIEMNLPWLQAGGGALSMLSQILSGQQIVGGLGGTAAQGAAIPDQRRGIPGRGGSGFVGMTERILGDRNPAIAAGAPIASLGGGGGVGGSPVDIGFNFWEPFSMSNAANRGAMQFAQEQGVDALQNSAAAKGGLLSTNTMRDIVDFGQKNAAQFQNQAFNQWLSDREAKLKPIQSLAGVGQSTASHVADQVGSMTMAGANARAGGIIGAGNAMAGAVGNLTNIGQQYAMYNNLFGGGGGGGGGGGVGAVNAPGFVNPNLGAGYGFDF